MINNLYIYNHIKVNYFVQDTNHSITSISKTLRIYQDIDLVNCLSDFIKMSEGFCNERIASLAIVIIEGVSNANLVEEE